MERGRSDEDEWTGGGVVNRLVEEKRQYVVPFPVKLTMLNGPPGKNVRL